MSLIEKYKAHERENGGVRHVWSVKNDQGGMHIWAVRHDDETAARYGERYWGGIEVHSPRPMYEDQGKPHHDHCWLLGGACWHDGSSLQFDERIAPILGDEIDEYDHRFVFNVLRERHASYFGEVPA